MDMCPHQPTIITEAHLDPAVCRQGAAETSQLKPQQLTVKLTAPDILELTLTRTVLDSYQALQTVIGDVRFVKAEPIQLANLISATDGASSPGGEALYWLQNLTDAPLEFWSEQPGQGHRALAIAAESADTGQYLCLNFALLHGPYRSQLLNGLALCIASTCKTTVQTVMPCLPC